MIVSKLNLFQFRNYSSLSCELNPGINYLVGKNAQGKTNFIEAFNLLSIARSYRTSKKSELLQWGTNEASVFGTVQHDTGPIELGVSLIPKKRILTVNGNPVKSATEFVGKLACVCFFPDDLSIVKAGPGGRRQLIDRHMTDLEPVCLSHLLRYAHALKHKVSVLKAGSGSRELLQPWNQLLVDYGAKVTQHRLTFLQKLQPYFVEAYGSISDDSLKPSVSLKSQFLDAEGSCYSISALEELVEQKIPTELQLRRCLTGPHLDDVEILIDGKKARSYASQGQTRSLVLALKIAVIRLLEAEREEAPVLLLDDVDSELDTSRREGLFELLLDRERQVIITGTDSAWERFPYKQEVHPLKVAQGSVVAAEAN